MPFRTSETDTPETRYWVIAPADYRNRDEFDRCWHYDRENGVIAIGWDLGGAPRSQEHLEELFRSTAERENWTRHGLHMLTKFWFEIQPGDRIIARAGRNRIVGIGEVQGKAYYDADEERRTWSSNFLPVRWDDTEERDFPDIVFGMQTVYELPKARFDELTSSDQTAGTAPGREENDVRSKDQTEFVLEKHLEEFIVSNFPRIFGNEISIYQDDEGRHGRQYPTDAGTIDILGRDSAGNYVVIELKKGKSSDMVVGQILRYMGWVREHLCKQEQRVRGIIICRDRDESLSYALSMIESVEVRLYRVSFQLIKEDH